jgi:hypothetical protein
VDGTAQRAGAVAWSIPAELDLTGMRAVEAWVRVAPAAGERRLRWLAHDGSGRLLFQRAWRTPGTGAWTRVEWPLATWRWGERVGRWAEVRGLALQVETRSTSLDLDGVALLNGGPLAALPDLEWVGQVAGPAGRWAEGRRGAHAIAIWTDAEGDAVGQQALATRLVGVAAWIDRLFGAAVRPVAEAPPVPLLVFATPEAYREFFERLGAAWGAEIRPPGSGGLTVQDIATSSWDAAQGWGRPVFLHETVHAVVARRLRIATRARGADWLQEGTATYLQLCAYPGAMRPGAWRELFARPVGEGGLARLADLLWRDIPGREYPQAASLVAFLVAEHADWLPTIARKLADGEGPEAAFTACGMSLSELERAWYAWGKATLAALPDDAPRHFPAPPELAE